MDFDFRLKNNFIAKIIAGRVFNEQRTLWVDFFAMIPKIYTTIKKD